MANIFRENLDVKETPNRNNFDLSFQNHLTMKMGTLYPVFCKPVVPGDSFNIKAAFGLKFMPLVFPVQSKMRAHMHFFYVRNKNLFDRWQDWISGLKGNADGVTPPYITDPRLFTTGSLADYLGCPTTVVTDDVQNISHSLNYYNVKSGVAAAPFTANPFLLSFNTAISGISLADTYFYLDPQFADARLTAGLSWCLFMSPVGHDHNFKPGAGTARTSLPSGVSPFFTHLAFAHGSGSLRFTTWEDDEDVLVNIRKSGFTFFSQAAMALTYSSGQYSYSMTGDYADAINAALAAGETVYPVLVATVTGTTTRTYADFQFRQTAPAIPALILPEVVFGVHDITDYSTDSNYYAHNAVSAMPFRAYEAVYNAYYRNSHGVDPFRINGSVEYNKFNTTTAGGRDATPYHLYQRNYELDFLTSALPSPQAGPAPLVGMSSLGRITVEDENGITTAQAELDDAGNITKVAVTSPLASVDHARTLMNMAALGMNINDFRQVNALQRHLEQTLRSGYRYIDFIAGHFGKSPEYRELDMPEFIGGFSRDVTVSQILQNTDTEPILDALGRTGSGSPLGSFAGNANAFGGSEHDINHYCDDYGYIIGILSVVPTPAYSQLMPKHFLYRDRLDYYFPEFAQIGMQPIVKEEVSPLQAWIEDEHSLPETFGYQRPNYDLVASTDEVHGNFRTDLRDFLINRRFAHTPELSPSFIQIHPEETNDVFANRTPSDDTIIGQILFEVYAKRPIPRVVIPSLGR